MNLLLRYIRKYFGLIALGILPNLFFSIGSHAESKYIWKGAHGNCVQQNLLSPSAEMKTIRNTEYGFSFQAPKNYRASIAEFDQATELSNPEDVRFLECAVKNRVVGAGHALTPIRIKVINIPENVQQLSDVTKTFRYQRFQILEQRNIRVAGQPALLIRDSDAEHSHTMIIIYLLVPNQQKLMEISAFNRGSKLVPYSENVLNLVSNSLSFSTRSSNVQSWKEQADRHYANNEYQQAISAYSEAIRLSPRYASLYYNRGISYHLSKSSKEAIADLQKAAQLYQEQGKNDDYRDTLARIIEIQPLNHFQSKISLDKKPAQAVLTEESRLRTNGIGSVLVGMTINQAEQASKYKFKETLRSGQCIQYDLQEGPKALWFLVNQGQIATVNVGNRQVATLRGVRIGDSEARVKELYRGQLQFSKDTPGSHQLIFIPKDAADRNYRLIFTINSQGKVSGYRAGRLPEVMWQEGCL
jgi:tetratricopeptide (TPR) repeat protein